MSNYKYNIGDHVVVEKSNIEYFRNFAGWTGTVVGYSRNTNSKTPYLIRMDEDCTCEIYCNVKCLVQSEEKIVITHNGKTTTATLYEDGKKVKTATAKCCPEDTFDFMVGAKLACQRLIGAPVTKYKVGDRIFAEDNVGEYPGGAWGTVVEVLDKRLHKEDYLVKFDNGYILCSHVVPVPTTPEPPKSKEETEWRVVNRPVRAGDYIRITRPTFSFDNKGDILRVSFVCKDGMAVVYAQDHPKETGHTGKFYWNYWDSEYEVVEKVTKTVEPPKPKCYNMKFNTGDRAKIIANKFSHNFEIGTIVTLEKYNIDYLATDDNGNSWWVIDDELEAYTPPKYYNGKVVCIKKGFDDSCPVSIFTIGKVYTVVDGVITSDTGYKSNEYLYVNDKIDADNLCSGVGWTFIPLVED